MPVSFALVHHANQYVITDGYENREGISTVLGSVAASGFARILELHHAYGIPLNLHISGTLMEAIAWHQPEFLGHVRSLLRAGLIELVGSCYGQNIMRFFGADYNRRQLNEELLLYRHHFGVDLRDVKAFWPPERVWDTRRIAPVLRDASLKNEGYRHVLVDDRLLLSPKDPDTPRRLLDEERVWFPELFQTCDIEGGLGLVAVPISSRLRRSILPRTEQDWAQVRAEFEALLVHSSREPNRDLIAVYADDLEKVSGLWSADGPSLYEAFLQWLAENRWVQPVLLTPWAAERRAAGARAIENGTFAELAHHFDAGEGYEKWFLAPDWAQYRRYFDWTDSRVKELAAAGADPALVELAEKQLLAGNWETAWHNPPDGPHGDAANGGRLSPWARALTSHCRHAAVTAEAARWMVQKDGRAHAELRDIDHDGLPELILKNDCLYAVVTPRWGGRLIALFSIAGSRGSMVVGNPCDDWNWLEELNRYMDAPRNHPGALADAGMEHQSFEVISATDSNGSAQAVLRGDTGIEKQLELGPCKATLTVAYRLPSHMPELSTEFGLSPDYLRLLREGSRCLARFHLDDAEGCRCGDIAVSVRPGDGAEWADPYQERCGHACMLRIRGVGPQFELEIGVALLDSDGQQSPKQDLETVLL